MTNKAYPARANCLYCGFMGEWRPFGEARAETLEHGRTCDKHPMRLIEAENDRLKAAIRELIRVQEYR